MSALKTTDKENGLAGLPLEDAVLLQIMKWERPSDENIAALFGEDAVKTFNYAYDVFEGQKRTDCDNPAIAHSYDVAYWVKKFLKNRYKVLPIELTNLFSMITHNILICQN